MEEQFRPKETVGGSTPSRGTDLGLDALMPRASSIGAGLGDSFDRGGEAEADSIRNSFVV